MTPQTSASDRYATARQVLNAYQENEDWYHGLPYGEQEGRNYEHYEDDLISLTHALAGALRALVTPPEAPAEDVQEVAGRVLSAPMQAETFTDFITEKITNAIRESIQCAHERWEPADVPSQEFMLRHLELEHNSDHRAPDEYIYIPEQRIEKEV